MYFENDQILFLVHLKHSIYTSQGKHHKPNSPLLEEMDEKEMLNIRGGSPEASKLDKDERQKSPRSEVSYDSEYASDHGKHDDKGNRGKRESRRDGKKNKSKNKTRDRNFKKEKNRETKAESNTDSKGICIFYLNGKCNKVRKEINKARMGMNNNFDFRMTVFILTKLFHL